jgi:hypothetical protein
MNALPYAPLNTLQTLPSLPSAVLKDARRVIAPSIAGLTPAVRARAAKELTRLAESGQVKPSEISAAVRGGDGVLAAFLRSRAAISLSPLPISGPMLPAGSELTTLPSELHKPLSALLQVLAEDGDIAHPDLASVTATRSVVQLLGLAVRGWNERVRRLSATLDTSIAPADVFLLSPSVLDVADRVLRDEPLGEEGYDLAWGVSTHQIGHIMCELPAGPLDPDPAFYQALMGALNALRSPWIDAAHGQLPYAVYYLEEPLADACLRAVRPDGTIVFEADDIDELQDQYGLECHESLHQNALWRTASSRHPPFAPDSTEGIQWREAHAGSPEARLIAALDTLAARSRSLTYPNSAPHRFDEDGPTPVFSVLPSNSGFDDEVARSIESEASEIGICTEARCLDPKKRNARHLRQLIDSSIMSMTITEQAIAHVLAYPR